MSVSRRSPSTAHTKKRCSEADKAVKVEHIPKIKFLKNFTNWNHFL